MYKLNKSKSTPSKFGILTPKSAQLKSALDQTRSILSRSISGTKKVYQKTQQTPSPRNRTQQ